VWSYTSTSLIRFPGVALKHRETLPFNINKTRIVGTVLPRTPPAGSSVSTVVKCALCDSTYPTPLALMSFCCEADHTTAVALHTVGIQFPFISFNYHRGEGCLNFLNEEHLINREADTRTEWKHVYTYMYCTTPEKERDRRNIFVCFMCVLTGSVRSWQLFLWSVVPYFYETQRCIVVCKQP
jgi:hypothetical protein